MTDQTRARWVKNSTDTWILKQSVKDGDAVLALVTVSGRRYAWTTYTTPIQIGAELSASDAKRAARRALRETENNV